MSVTAGRADHYIQPAALRQRDLLWQWTSEVRIYRKNEGERERGYGLRPPCGIPTHFLCGAKQRDGEMEGGLVSYLFI